MEINYNEGCALCGGTWGEYWDEIDGEKMLFCCSICHAAFKNMIDAVKKDRSWKTVEKLEITGNNAIGRDCTASTGGMDFRFYIKFFNDGRIYDFHAL